MKLSVVISTSNGRRFLEKCLPAVRASRVPTGHELEVVVVDNGSADDSLAYLRANSWVKSIVHPSPLGFSKANNAARGIVTGDVICFLNNDTAPRQDWLERPLQLFSEDAGVVGVGSKLVFMHRFVRVRFEVRSAERVFVDAAVFGCGLDDKIRWRPHVFGHQHLGRARGWWVRDGDTCLLPLPVEGLDSPPPRPPAFRVLAGPDERGLESVTLHLDDGRALVLRHFPGILSLRGWSALPAHEVLQNAGNSLNSRGEGGDVGTGDEPELYDHEEVVPAICGAAFFARRRELDRAGWFPEYYRSYYEDVDLALNLRRGGGQLVFCPKSVVYHYHTGTNRELSPFFVENVARSSLLFLTRHAQPPVVLASLERRLHDVRAELAYCRAAGHRGRKLWDNMHGLRGLVRAAQKMPSVVLQRMLDRAAGGVDPATLMAGSREAYVAPGGGSQDTGAT